MTHAAANLTGVSGVPVDWRCGAGVACSFEPRRRWSGGQTHCEKAALTHGHSYPLRRGFIVDPSPGINNSASWPQKRPLPVELVIFKLTDVLLTTGVGDRPLPVALVIFELTYVLLTTGEGDRPLPVVLVIFELTDVLLTTGEGERPKAVIPISIGIRWTRRQ